MPRYQAVPDHQALTQARVSVWEGALDNRFAKRLASPCRVLLVGPLPPGPLMGGVETGVQLLMSTRLAETLGMQLFNTGRIKDPNRSTTDRVLFQFKSCLRFFQSVKRLRPRVVHIKTSSGINFYQNTLYVLIARLLGKRVVLQLHSGGFPAFYDASGRGARAIIRWALRRPHRLAALSDHWADYFRSLSGVRSAGVVSNATDMKRYATAAADPDYFGIPEGRVTILFVSTRSRELDVAKGICELIPALVEVRKTCPEVLLVIAGHVSHRLELEELLGLEGNTWMSVGVVEPDDKPALYSSVDMFVLPSHYENMPNTLIEAMAAGVACVATPVGAIPEMIDDARSGLIVQVRDVPALAEKLSRLAGDAELRSTLGAAARRTAECRFDLVGLEDALSREYEQLG